jgi:hypothetical protein
MLLERNGEILPGERERERERAQKKTRRGEIE